MSSVTSQNTRSAPAPPRSESSACSIEPAWVTFAPRSIAILVAAPIWPFRPPTMRRRMVLFLLVSSLRSSDAGLDDFGHGDAQPVFDQHDFAARHQAVIHIDVDGFAHLAVEFDHRALAQLEQLADFHRRSCPARPKPSPARRTPLPGPAAECFGAASAASSLFSRAAGAPAAASWLRSGRSTLSVPDMAYPFKRRSGLGKTACDQGVERGFDRGFAAFAAAAAPFDAAIGACRWRDRRPSSRGRHSLLHGRWRRRAASSAATTSGAARKVMRGSPIAWCMASRKAHSRHRRRAAPPAPRGRSSWRRRSASAAASARTCFDFGMALIQRSAQRDRPARRWCGRYSRWRAPAAASAPSAWARAHMASISSVVRVCFWRARAACGRDIAADRGTRCRR